MDTHQQAQQALAALRGSMERLGDEELRVTRLTGASGDAQVRGCLRLFPTRPRDPTPHCSAPPDLGWPANAPLH